MNLQRSIFGVRNVFRKGSLGSSPLKIISTYGCLPAFVFELDKSVVELDACVAAVAERHVV